jgi:hypothetical protein|tara:strand:- start:1294 stop:3162 length:1869 start_codon:yes stop_codon:yes gene_type:complete
MRRIVVFLKILLYFILVSIILNTSSSAFHEKGLKEPKIFYSNKSITELRKKFCTYNVKKLREGMKHISNDEDVPGYKIFNYHTSEATPVSGLISIIDNEKINEDTKIEEVLKMYCVQDKTKDRPVKINADMKKLFDKIAKNNNLVDRKKTISSANINDGVIIIEEENILIFYPDFLLALAKEISSEGEKPDEEPTNQTIKPEPDPKPEFDMEKRDKLETAAENKKLEFDDEINKLRGLKNEVNTNYEELKINYQTSLNKVEETLKYTKNTDILEIRKKLKELENLKKEHFEGTKLKKLKGRIISVQNHIDGLEKSEDYKSIEKLITKINNAEKKKNHSLIINQTVEKIDKRQLIEATGLKDEISDIKSDISAFEFILRQRIDPLRKEIDQLDLGDEEGDFVQFIVNIAIYIAIFLFVVAVITFIYLQNRKIRKLSKISQSAETKFSDMEDKLKTTSEKINLARAASRSRSSLPPKPEQPPEEPKTVTQIRTEKFEDLKRDYLEALDNFSKVASFKQKWKGLGLSKKPRQETAKTVLINSPRPFEKSEIWCLSFEEKYVAFPGSSVKKDMAIYMNFDFQKAEADLKGAFNITSGSSYSVKPCSLRRGGAGFVVEHAGEIQFPK